MPVTLPIVLVNLTVAGFWVFVFRMICPPNPCRLRDQVKLCTRFCFIGYIHSWRAGVKFARDVLSLDPLWRLHIFAYLFIINKKPNLYWYTHSTPIIILAGSEWLSSTLRGILGSLLHSNPLLGANAQSLYNFCRLLILTGRLYYSPRVSDGGLFLYHTPNETKSWSWPRNQFLIWLTNKYFWIVK